MRKMRIRLVRFIKSIYLAPWEGLGLIEAEAAAMVIAWSR